MRNIDDLVRVNRLVLEVYGSYSVVNWPLLQGAFYSRRLTQNFKKLYAQFSSPLAELIDILKQDGKCHGATSDIASRIIITGLAHSASMFHSGYFKCTRHEFALNTAKFMSGFLNFVP